MPRSDIGMSTFNGHSTGSLNNRLGRRRELFNDHKAKPELFRRIKLLSETR